MSSNSEVVNPELLAYLEQNVAGFCGPARMRKFSGGQSNPTYKLTAASGQYVLRRQPPGKLLKSAHAVDREFRVQRRLVAGGLAPRQRKVHRRRVELEERPRLERADSEQDRSGLRQDRV